MAVAIVGNGDLCDLVVLKDYTIVIAVDGGANHCLMSGITPTYSIGDGDSIRSAPPNFQRMDDDTKTDLMKGLALAKQVAPTELIELFCVTSGDRLDHSQAALWALQYHAQVSAIHAPNQTLYHLKPNQTQALPDQQMLSVIPTTAAAVVELVNCEWSGRVTLNDTYSGISNSTQANASIQVVSGCVIVSLWN